MNAVLMQKNSLWVDDELKLRVPGDQVPTLLAFFFQLHSFFKQNSVIRKHLIKCQSVDLC